MSDTLSYLLILTFDKNFVHSFDITIVLFALEQINVDLKVL